MKKALSIIPKVIENKIFLIRGKKVMLDRDLAGLYGVETRILNQAVKRNSERFPEDFMFQLSNLEKNEVITNCDNLKNLKYNPINPYAFTEQGIAMLSGVLNSPLAIQVNIQIMRTFTKLREIIFTHKDLQLKIEQIIRQQEKQHGKLSEHDKQISVIFDAIKQLLTVPEKPKNKIGFVPDSERNNKRCL
ncbi:putative ORF6N domain protein [Candidatus Termititenax dinenymphae]|uniref:ORF6N domain protein n=1 Tax=Candidatus Termititenax dinenymphae TaxID=2218523 RepID=A0A388TMJ5_9BACT|nr:putative ORF6N domain protein [Candidatus Termititenax dinenymphae]